MPCPVDYDYGKCYKMGYKYKCFDCTHRNDELTFWEKIRIKIILHIT